MGRKFTIFALFYFVFEGKFHVQAPRGLIFGGRFNGFFFLRYNFEGLIFSDFYGMSQFRFTDNLAPRVLFFGAPVSLHNIHLIPPPPPTYLSFFSGSSNFSGRRFKYFVIPENNIGSALCREFSWSILVA